MKPIRVVLVDDHDVVRRGLRAVIDAEADLDVVGEAANAAEGLRRVGFDEPDVVVLDVRLPDGSGIEVCRDIRQRFPDVRVLILTSFADEQALLSAILAGASGYSLKRIRTDDLLADIRRVAAGDNLLDSGLAADLADRLGDPAHGDPLLARLSVREKREILHLIADGRTNHEIAEHLDLSDKTVKNYISNLLAKMGMSRRIEAAAHLLRVTSTDDYPPEEWSGSPLPPT